MSSPQSAPNTPRIIFAGDRDIAVQVLDVLCTHGVRPIALLLPSRDRASHAAELRQRCNHLDDALILRGSSFRSDENRNRLRYQAPDYLISVHFPYYVPPSVLTIPSVAALNLHPAYLPYNRGWHTPSWAILDDAPFGATLHVMTDELDAGPIVHQKRLSIRPNDTAHTLYQRVKKLELEVFKEAWPSLQDCSFSTSPQPSNSGTRHEKSDLLQPEIQHIQQDEYVRAGDLIDRLRALTTNQVSEAAYIECGGQRFRLQLQIIPEDAESDASSPASS